MGIYPVFMTVVHLGLALGLLLAARTFYERTGSRAAPTREASPPDAAASAPAAAGYFVALSFAVGGAVSAPPFGFWRQVFAIVLYGVLSLVLLHLTKIATDRLILFRPEDDEPAGSANPGIAVVTAGAYTATGLIVHGGVAAPGIGFLGLLAFWGVGVAVLILAAFEYDLLAPYDTRAEIEAGNVGAGISLAGYLTAFGNLVRAAASGVNTTLSASLWTLLGFFVLGAVLLPLARIAVGWILQTSRAAGTEGPLPPGSALAEAASYVGASLLIGWVL